MGGHPILSQDVEEPLPHWPAFCTHSPDPGPSSRILSQSCCWHRVVASHVPSLWGPERDMIRGRGRVGEANQTKAELGMSLESSPQHARAGDFLPSCPATCSSPGTSDWVHNSRGWSPDGKDTANHHHHHHQTDARTHARNPEKQGSSWEHYVHSGTCCFSPPTKILG